MTDEELLTEYFTTKRHDALTMLHDRMRDRLYALALHMLHSPEDAEDVVQAVFLKLCNLAPREVSSAEAFLKTMVKHLALNRQRDNESGVRHGMVSLETFEPTEWIEDDSEFDGRIAPKHRDVADSSVTSVESQAQTNELWQKTKAALGGLSPTQREAIELYHCRGLEPAEIASVLGVKEKTVRTRIRRGMAELRETFFPEQEVKSRPYLKPLLATDPQSGAPVCEFPSIACAIRAGYKSSDCLYRALRKGTTYKGLNWSYASAV